LAKKGKVQNVGIRVMLTVHDVKPSALPRLAQQALIALGRFADGNGRCWPSLPRLAAAMKVSERSALSAVVWLKKHGLIEIERANHRGVNHYTLIWPAIKALPRIPTWRERSARARTAGAADETAAAAPDASVGTAAMVAGADTRKNAQRTPATIAAGQSQRLRCNGVEGNGGSLDGNRIEPQNLTVPRLLSGSRSAGTAEREAEVDPEAVDVPAPGGSRAVSRAEADLIEATRDHAAGLGIRREDLRRRAAVLEAEDAVRLDQHQLDQYHRTTTRPRGGDATMILPHPRTYRAATGPTAPSGDVVRKKPTAPSPSATAGVWKKVTTRQRNRKEISS
jgi:hypothetical protein